MNEARQATGSRPTALLTEDEYALLDRFMARRQAGHFGPADLLVIVLIADAAQTSSSKVEAPIGRHPVARTRMAVVARGKLVFKPFVLPEGFDLDPRVGIAPARRRRPGRPPTCRRCRGRP